MSSAEWITDRLPTEADGDHLGLVRLKQLPGNDADGYLLVHWSHVGAGAPWQHTRFWKPPAEPAPTEPTPAEPDRIAALEQQMVDRIADLEERTAGAINDRIAALERRVAERDRAQSVLTAALANRLSALEGVAPDGAVPAKVPGGIAALERRVAELETQLRPSTESFEVSYQQARANELRSKASLLLAQAKQIEAEL